MNSKKFLICILIIFLNVASAAGEVSLNRWVLNVTLHDDGLTEEVIQAEIENGGSSNLDGFSFVVPASHITVIYDFDHTSSFTGQVIEQQAVSGKTRITVNFNNSIEAGKKWNGRIGFMAENWAVKEGLNYSIEIPIEAPQAIISGKNTAMSVPGGADIRSQVFLPKAVEPISVEIISKEPAPYKKLFQFDHVVLTWFQVHTGDVIHVKGSFSSLLNEIVKTDEKTRSLSARIKEAKVQGREVSEAEAHLRNAEDYNTNQALASFWKKEDAEVLKSVGNANDELTKAENSLSVKEGVKETPRPTDSKKTPGFEASILIFILLITLVLWRKK